MAPCSHPGQTQGREWWVSPRRLLSIGQPRTANPAGEHDTSAKKASLPGHCTCKRLRGPHEDRKKHRPPVTLDCSSTVPPACGDPRNCGRARVSTKQSIEPYTTPPHSTGGAGTLTTPSPNLVRVEPGAENPPRWYDAPTTPTTARAQPSCTWGKRAWVRHPPFFGRLGGISLGPQSAGSPLQQEVAPRRWRYMGRPTPAPVPREGAVTVSARPGRLPETAPTVGGRRPDVLLPTHPPSGACATRLGPVPPPNPRFIQSEGGGPGAVSSLFRNPLGGTGEGGRGGQIFRTPLLAPELSFWVAEAPGRQGPAPPAKPRLVRSEGGGHRSDGTSLSVTHRGGPARGGRGV